MPEFSAALHDQSRVNVMFDDQIFVAQRYGGVSRVFVELARRLPQHGVDPHIAAPLHRNAYLRELPDGMISSSAVDFSAHPRKADIAMKLARRLPNFFLDRAIASTRAAVLHETYYPCVASVRRDIPVVTTVHDMIHELAVEFADSPVINHKRRAMDRSDAIVCVSQSTQAYLTEIYPQFASKSRVILNAATVRQPQLAESPQPRPYLLYVGTRQARYKNFSGVISAIQNAPDIFAGIDLVCSGGGPLSGAEQGVLASAGLSGRVNQFDADDQLLAELYAHAECLVYPSYREGFGLPPLEAMMLGCPVVALDILPVREVCGDAAEYASSHTPEALALAIESVVRSAHRRGELARMGQERATLFDWNASAGNYATLYREMAG